MDQAFLAARLSKKEMAYGGVGVFSIIIINSLSIGVLFGFTGIREVVLVLFLWVSIILWNENVFWGSWCFNLLKAIVPHYGNGYITLAWNMEMLGDLYI